MTVSAGAAKAGPFTGNNIVSTFAFTFKVFADEDIRVVETLISTGVETDLELNTDYTVARNADQDSDPGGEITYYLIGVPAPLPSTKKITIVGNYDYEQPTDLPNGGAFFAASVENALDRATMQIKQLAEQVDRAVKVSVSSTDDPGTLVDTITTAAADAAASAAAAAATVDEFNDIYLGSKASDPATDNDGDALAEGQLYWNSASNRLRIYGGAAWADTATAAPSSFTADSFDGTGAQTAFTLSDAPANVQSALVFISGVRQKPTTDYTVSGTTLTFTSAPPSGTGNVTVLTVAALAAGVPDDDSVSTPKIQDEAVTLSKLAASAIAALANPAGTVIYVAMSSAPTGYIKANGAAISRTTYADLFAAIGTTFGAGDGSTTFNLPDLRGEFTRGWDDGRGVDSGRVFGSAQADAFKSHTHDINNTSALGSTKGAMYYADEGDSSIASVNRTLSAGDAETRPRNIALLACIKY